MGRSKRNHFPRTGCEDTLVPKEADVSDMEKLKKPFTVRYAEWIVAHRRWVAVVGVAVALAIGSGGRFLIFEDSYRYFFREDNPQLKAFDRIENTYGKSDGILFVIAPQAGTVFEPEVAQVLSELTAAAWKIPNASRVDSPTNFQHTSAQGDDLSVTDLIPKAHVSSADALRKASQVAAAEPLLHKRLVADDRRTAGVNVTLELPGKVAGEQEPAVAAARTIAHEITAAHPNIAVHLTGMAMMGNAFSESALADLATLTPLMYLIVLAASYFFLRSVSATFAILTVIGLASAVGMGGAGWLGIRLTPPSTNAPTMIMTVCVADSIHVLVAVIALMRAGKAKHEAIIEGLSTNMRAVFLTSVTTIIGLLAMNYSDVRPLNDLGNISAMGVTAAWLLTITVLPALTAMLPIRAAAGGINVEPAFGRLASWIDRHARVVVWSCTAFFLLTGAMLFRNRLDDRFVQYFDESVQFRRDTDIAVERLTGIYNVEFSIDSGKPGGVADPDYLRALDQLAEWYRGQPGVVQVNSLSDTFKRLNRSMHGDDPKHMRTPEERELAAQYLLLYELSLPYGLDLTNQIDIAKSASRFTVTAGDVSAAALRDLAARGEQWLREHAPSYAATPSSTSLMFAHISQRNIESMFVGTFYSFVLIAGILMVSLRSLYIGALSVVPNLLPSIAAFGVWGLLVGEVNLGLSMVAAVSFGIIVDDTVYFLSKYMHARKERGANATEAVRYALEHVGPAMSVTSAVLVAGFLVLACSAFALNSDLGKLTALVLSVGVVGDLLFLPALLICLDGRQSEVRVASGELESAAPAAE